jgi:hypothetical protein
MWLTKFKFDQQIPNKPFFNLHECLFSYSFLGFQSTIQMMDCSIRLTVDCSIFQMMDCSICPMMDFSIRLAMESSILEGNVSHLFPVCSSPCSFLPSKDIWFFIPNPKHLGYWGTGTVNNYHLLNFSGNSVLSL